MPETPCYKAPPSRSSALFRGEHIVYTEDAGGSSPSSPTSLFNNLREIREGCDRFIEPDSDVCYKKSGLIWCANTASALTETSDGAPVMADLPPITVAVFWSKVSVPASRSDCWEWHSTVNSQGYGRININRKWIAAHRLSYELVNGPIEDGLIIRHRCHNRLCCNPNHLEKGTSKDNALDAIEAGRFARGSINGNSKLTDDLVRYIRRNPDRLKGRDLADKLGLSPATISGVKNGRVWKHVA